MEPSTQSRVAASIGRNSVTQKKIIDPDALLLLLNVGVGAIASAPSAAHEIYGFDLEDPSDRERLAAALGAILRSGLLT